VFRVTPRPRGFRGRLALGKGHNISILKAPAGIPWLGLLIWTTQSCGEQAVHSPAA
jgi:hypothetical protein